MPFHILVSEFSMRSIYFLFAVVILMGSCTKDFEGDANPTPYPETFAVVDSVLRDTDQFLVTTVSAYWWGSSPKGFIKGFEVSTDGMQSWQFTTEQKGTFLLNLPVGVKKGKIPVYIRAIDNLDRKDPTPAQIVFPVENSAPRVNADLNTPIPDVSFPVIRLAWISSDVDGPADIDHYELSLNDTTTLFTISGTLSDLQVSDTSVSVSIRIEGQRNNGVFISDALVYGGSKTIALPGLLTGLKYDSVNYIYIRAIDKTGNQSMWLRDSVLIKRPKSDMLLVNALYANGTIVQNFYVTNLAKPLVGISNVESLRGVNSILGSSELYADAMAQQRTFALFKKIIWLTDDPNTLATAQAIPQEYFANGGKMFIYAQFGDDYPLNAGVLSFTPIQSLVDPASKVGVVNGRFRMDNSCTANPVLNGWPKLQYSGSISVARPFFTNATTSGLFSYDSLMNAVVRIQSSSGSPYWDGPSTTMSRRVRTATGKSDLIITSLPLQNLNGSNNMDSFFRKVFIDELAFQ